MFEINKRLRVVDDRGSGLPYGTNWIVMGVDNNIAILRHATNDPNQYLGYKLAMPNQERCFTEETGSYGSGYEGVMRGNNGVTMSLGSSDRPDPVSG